MKCRICGAKLRKDGDICKTCYEEYCKEETLEKDVKESYKLHRKYIPLFQLSQYIDWIIIAFFVFITFIAQAQFAMAIIFILIALIILGIVMFLAKRKAINTTCTFYEKKIVWKYKDKRKTIAYVDIKEITYYQTRFQKLFDLADIQIRPEKGNYLINGFEIKNVPDFENTWKKIEEIIQSKKEK